MFLKRVAAGLTAAAVLACPAIASAAPAPVTNVELGVPVSDFVGQRATFNPADSAEIGMPAVRKLRSEMWDINPPLDGRPLRDVAKSYGLDTKERYVNDISDNGNLTIIAIQRALEIEKHWDHSRPTTANCETSCGKESDAVIVSNGVSSWGQNLASNSEYNALDKAISQQWGHGELAALRQANGHWSKQNGHLYWLVHPRLKQIGFGAVHVNGDGYYTSAFGPVSGNSRVPSRADALPNRQYNVVLYRSADGTERPTGLVAQNVNEGSTVVVPLRLGGFDNATDVTVGPDVEATVNKTTGELTFVAPAVEADQIIAVPVTVTYADGTQETMTPSFNVVDRPVDSAQGSSSGESSSADSGNPESIVGIIVGILSLIGVIVSFAGQAGLLPR